MQNITIERSNVNSEALDEVLSSVLGADFLGMSTGPYGVILHLEDAVVAADIDAAKQMVQLHDPSVQTVAQQAQSARETEINNARGLYSEAIDLAAFGSADALVQQLAERLRWLEQEVRDLRGL